MINTKLTQRFAIRHPIIQAPMALAAGGKLAAAIANAGGLGLIGGAYGDADWLRTQFREATGQQVGCGFITWSLQQRPELLEQVIEFNPAALFLSFGDPAPFAKRIQDCAIPLICQIQNLRDARHAIDIGADVIVAQGTEAGGHGESRTTFTLVPEVANAIATQSSNAILCAAGGIADGRGLAAALLLGADGALVGSRFWASTEALVHPNMLHAAVSATGDDTVRSTVMDVARHLKWPSRYTARVLNNAFTDRWHADIEGLMQVAGEQAARWKAAWIAGDTDTANTFVGEVTGIIQSVKPASEILNSMTREAEQALKQKCLLIE